MKNKFLVLLTIIMSTMVVSAQSDYQINLLDSMNFYELPGSAFYDNINNEIWGYEKDGVEYAIIGSTMGTHIIDVTNPEDISEIHFIEGAFTGANVVHRDYHDYNDYLYIVCDEGPSTLQIVDLSGLPETVELVYDSAELFNRSHNIFIDTANHILYSCGGPSTLMLFDLTDPVNPEFIIDCGDSVEGWNEGPGYIHDIYVENGIGYLNAGLSGLYIVDFNNPEEPEFLGSLTDYEESGYNHSGWLHENGEIYALADETHGTRIKILDVSDPTDIQTLSLIGSEVTENSIVHNLIFKGDHLHVSYYYDGYYVFDISDPENPFLVDSFDTSTELNFGSYKGAWGVYPFLPSEIILVSDMQEGLFVFELEEIISVEENPDGISEVMVFPNPVKESVQLKGLEQAVDYNVNVYDSNGNIVLGKRVSGGDKSKIFLSELASGIYWLTLQSNNNFHSIRIIKE